MKHTHNSQIQSPSKTLLFPQNKYLLIHKTTPFSSATNKTLQDKKNEPGKKVGKKKTLVIFFRRDGAAESKQASSVMNKLQRFKEREKSSGLYMVASCVSFQRADSETRNATACPIFNLTSYYDTS